MLFPNYTSIPEGKFIYKNIMKKQKVIDMIEAMEEKNNKKSKHPSNRKSESRIFDTKIYESIAFEPDTSKIKEIFNLKKDTNPLSQDEDSDMSLDKFVNILTDIVDTVSINENTYAISTATTLNATARDPINKTLIQNKLYTITKNHKIKLSLNPQIKLGVKTKLNLKMNNTNSTTPMPSIDAFSSRRNRNSHGQRKISSGTGNNLVINHKYLQSMPCEITQTTKRSRDKKRVSSNNIFEMFNNSTRSNSQNSKFLTTINHKTFFSTTSKIPLKPSQPVSTKISSLKTPRRIIFNEGKLNIFKMSKNNQFSTQSGWNTDRKLKKNCLKLFQ